MSQRNVILFAALSVIATLGCSFSWLQLLDAKGAARDAALNLAILRDYEGEIETLRTFDSNALMLGEQPVEASSTWVKFGSVASIAESQFSEITRLPLAQIEKTPYSRDDVIIRLTNVTVEQVVQFGIEASNASSAYSLLSVRLSASRQTKPDNQETWDAGLVLTRILYTAKRD